MNVHYRLAGLLIFAVLTSALGGCSTDRSSTKTARYIEIADDFVSTALNDGMGYSLLEELSSFGPRLTGSEKSMQAIIWAKARMEELGFERVTLQPVAVPHWQRGDVEEVVMVDAKYEGLKLHIASLGGSIATPVGGIIAEVVEVQSFEELHRLREEAEGKIIFFNRPMDPGTLDTFAAYGSAVSQRTAGPSEAAKIGGVAAIVRSVTTRYDNVPHVGTLTYEVGVGKIPAVAIGLIDADFLSSALKADPHLKVKLRLSCRMLEGVESYNVIGQITGIEKPDDIIVVGGHFDSWDMGDGSHDDGAGCIQSLEVLNLFDRLGIKPKRTIRAVFFINEEFGLDGARVYGDYAARSAEIHIAAIESDRGAFTPRGFSVTAEPAALKKIQSWLPLLNRAMIEWVKSGGSGADIAHIKNARALIGYVPDVQRYFDFHHSDNDVVDAVHPREFELGSAAMAILAYLLSEERL